MGASNVFERQKDSSIFEKEYAERFDGVLCDVPCSGFGTVTENPDIKLFKKLEDFPSLNKAQAQILSACSKYVKVGGALYYSTCSLFERENDKIVGAFLKENENFEVEEISSPLPFLRKQYGLQFLPDEAFGAGFYVAKLKRKS
jgi:16S rRNA (cytosine967-C5)-methyltransferase